MDGVRRCKLYDYANHAWLDFDGRVTARVTLANADAVATTAPRAAAAA
jgi:hypothetical protein